MSEQNKKKPNVITIVVAVIIVITVLFYFLTFQVRITEKAVVKTFGKPTSTIDPTKDSKPGLYWKLPYPFQEVNTFDARMRIFTGTLEQIFTVDSKSIILQTYTGWQIDNPQVFLAEVGTEQEAQTTLESYIRNHTNTVISKYSFNQIISKDQGISFLEYVEKTIKLAINEQAKVLGISVGEFGFRRLVLPESATKEVSERMKEERNQLAEKYRSEGASEADMIRNSADAFREQQLINARAEAKKIEGEAFAEIEKEYAVFAQEKELAIWIRKLDALKKILKANRSTLLLDPSTAPFDLLQNPQIQPVPEEKLGPIYKDVYKEETPKQKQTDTSSSSSSKDDATPVEDPSPPKQADDSEETAASEETEATTDATPQSLPEKDDQNAPKADPDGEAQSSEDAPAKTSEEEK